MFPRNLTLFRYPPQLDLSSLEDGVGDSPLKPVGPMELSSRGFVSPFGRDHEQLVHRQGDFIWLAIGGEDKILPAAAVNNALEKKLSEIEKQEGRRPSGRTRKRIKDEVITDLLPRALVKPSRVDIFLDTRRGVVIVDTSSRKTAENCVGEIRRALGSFPALPLNAEIAPRSVLTSWAAGDPLPEGLTLGDECELRDPIDQGAIVKCSRQELRSDEIDKHLDIGKQCTRLGLTLNDHVSFVLGEDLVIRKFKLLDGAVDALEYTEREDLRAELDARFALFAGEFQRLFFVLVSALRISKVD